MAGAAGSDSSIFDNASDVISELAGEVFDTVYASVSTSLADNTDRLILTASFLTGTGNADDNTLAGTAGSGTLNGGVGADFMTPGNGDDTYYVDNGFESVAATKPGGVDTISRSINLSLAANVENLVLTGGCPDWYRQQRRQPDHRDWL